MLSTLKRVARRMLRPPLHKPSSRLNYQVLGTDYGGWPLLTDFTRPGSVIYSFGIGEDISFDLAAIEAYGCRVIGFDPTPRSRAWLGTQSLPDHFAFYPVGIAAEDGEVEFFAPDVEGHVSYSMTPSPGTKQPASVMAPVMRFERIVSTFDLPPPDILKMDIEGFEYEVIEDLLKGPLLPEQLLVEFHHGIYENVSSKDTNSAVGALTDAGYHLYYVSETGREYGFYRPKS